MSPTWRRITQIIILGCVYSLAVFIRVSVCQHFVRKEFPFLPFTGESALLYRYAEMIATGEGVPTLDRSAQYPEGLFVKHQLSLGWEFISGSIYRLFFRGTGVQFHSFARYFTPFFFSLGIFALFLVIREVARARGSGLAVMSVGAIVGAMFYAVSLPAVIRSTGQEISRENYCLPLLFFHIYFLIRHLRDRRMFSSLAAGLFLFLSLTFWEGAQVYFYVLVVFMTLNFILNKDHFRWLPVYTVITISSLLAGILIPYLRSHFFITSYPVLVSCALVVAGQLAQKYPKLNYRSRKMVTLLVIVLALVLITHAFSGYGKTYSHMRSLLWYKLRFLNQKPYDPKLLPFGARIMWTPALTSPSGKIILFHFSTLLLLGIVSTVSVVIRMFRRGIGFAEEFLFVNLLIFFLLYLMFRRMEVFLIFFMCIFIGNWVGMIVKYPKKKAIPLYSLVFVLLLYEGSRVITYVDSIGRPVDYKATKNLISWVKKETPRESVVLSHFSLSPPILLYTGRKIVLHPKYESYFMREKVKEYLCSLFSHDEENFYSFCQKVGAQFFIYPRGTFSTRSRYSWRYMTGTLLSDRNCNAYLFESSPRELDKFELMYDNGRYMVYKIYQPDDLEMANSHLERGTTYLEKHRYEDAIKEYTECIRIYPKCAEAYAKLGTAYYLWGEEEKGKEMWNTYYRMRYYRKQREK